MLSKSTHDLRRQKSLDNSNDDNNNNDYENSDEFIILANNSHVTTAVENIKNELLSTKDTIMDKDHLDFYGQDIKDFPIILSYKIETVSSTEYIKAILRLKEDNYYVDIPCPNGKEPIIPHQICKFIEPNLKIKLLNPILIPNATKLIKNFDEHSTSKAYKFGIIYMKKGQTTEEELFSNQTHSEAFEEFLNFIGKRVELKDFKGFKGGLDTAHGQTGVESVYEKFHDREIMFHVSTLLPYSKSDSQQLERKRHIGNDIVTIIFQDESTPFAPDMIASNFLHAFIVVQKFKLSENDKSTRYRVAVSARNGVPNFLPEIPKCATFDKSKLFKEWLLLKLINAETACCKAEKFKKLKERTRYTLLDELYKDINQQNQKLIQAITYNNTYNDLNNNAENSDNSSNNSQNSNVNPSGLVINTNGKNEAQIMNTASTTSVTAATTSGSFKFNLFNNMRKAFKIKSNHTDKASATTSPTTTTTATTATLRENASNPAFTLPHNLPPIYSNDQMSNNSRGRLRSVTIDAPTPVKFSTKSLKENKQTEVNKLTLITNDAVLDAKKNLKELSQQQNGNKNHQPPNGLELGRISGINYDKSMQLPSPSEESSPKSLNSAQNLIIANPNDINDFALKKKQFTFRTVQSNISASQDNVILVEDSDTGLGSLTPNSSGISSSTSFVTDQSINENTSDTLTTLGENDLKINSIMAPLNNNSNKNVNSKSYFKNAKRRAETLNDQLIKIKGQENTNIMAQQHNEVF